MNKLQRISRKFRFYWIATLTLFLAACVPTSENPLPISEETPLDTELYGAWIGSLDAEDDPVFLHFLKTQDDDTKAILITAHRDGLPDDGSWAEFDVTSSALANGTYLNLTWIHNDGQPVEDLKGIHLLRYVIDENGELSLYFMDGDIVADAIEAGTLDGEITSSGFTRTIRLSASSADLASFIEAQDPVALFSEFYGSFKKAL